MLHFSVVKSEIWDFTALALHRVKALNFMHGLYTAKNRVARAGGDAPTKNCVSALHIDVKPFGSFSVSGLRIDVKRFFAKTP